MKTYGDLRKKIMDADPQTVKNCLLRICEAWFCPNDKIDDDTELDSNLALDSDTIERVTEVLSRFDFWPED